MAKKRQTAEEIVSRLEVDPEYQKRMSARKVRLRRLEVEDARIWQPIKADLLAARYAVDTVDDLMHAGRLPSDLVEILLNWLPRLEDKGTLEIMIRGMAAVNEPFDGSELVKCFERMEHEPGLQWVIANTIACSKPHSIDEWIDRLRENNYWRETLDDLGYKRKKKRAPKKKA